MAEEYNRYVPDPDPLVQQRLERWRDLKFGLLMHWGPYSQWGIVESWSICPEDENWCVPDTVTDYFSYKNKYENLPKTFNPVKFDPQKWAKAAHDVGMKYMVFTTKHHDGFCMFDTRYTDYKITGPDSPFRDHPKSNITKEIFNAFRDQGLWIGAYFSKPDWHSEDYWWRHFPPFDHNVNYDVDKYPDRWQRFVEFTHNQVMELCTEYGKVDILWFDGVWVQKLVESGDEPFIPGYTLTKDNSADPEKLKRLPNIPGYHVKKIQNQDIRMDELVARVRKVQPGIIVVDRAVHGKNQNYLTPENKVPDKMLPYPWESCIIMGGRWSFSFNARMKPSRELIHTLIDIVAKGGNLLLNIGVGPDGTWYAEAYDRLKDMGEWLKINGEAIYGTRAIAPYFDAKLRYTRQKDGSVFVVYLLDEGESQLPEHLVIRKMSAANDATVTLLGSPGTNLKWENKDENIIVNIPTEMSLKLPSKYAVTIKISKTECD